MVSRILSEIAAGVVKATEQNPAIPAPTVGIGGNRHRVPSPYGMRRYSTRPNLMLALSHD
jgi:hypothetical protein